MVKINFVRIFACTILCFILVHSFTGEKIAMNDGAGWDGLFYRNVSANFTEDIVNTGYDSFRLQRIAPFALINVIYTLLDIPKDNDSLMIGVLLLNAFSIVVLLIYFFKISNLLKWSLPTELIAFSLTFFNFHTLKYIGYEPFQTDAFALTLAFMSMFYYLRNELWKMVVIAIMSSFVWPLLGLTGLIMAFFPRTKVSPIANTSKKTIQYKLLAYGIPLGYLFLIGIFALVKNYRDGASHFNEIILFTSDSVPFIYFVITSLCVALILHFFIRPISLGIFDFLHGLLQNFTKKKAVALLTIYICIQVAIHMVANHDFFYSAPIFIFQMCIRPLQAPFIFLENHFLYWGLLPLLCIFFWKGIVHEIEDAGYGYFVVMAALLLFSLDSESRHSITFLPLLLVPLTHILESIRITPYFASVLTFFSLLFSRFYYTINVEGIQQAFETMEMSVYKTFPAQRYFMNFGPWQSNTTYLIASAIALLSFAVLYFLLRKITQTRE